MAAAEARQPAPLKVAEDGDPVAPPAQVYVDDSFEAADEFARSRKLAARGLWHEAAEVLQRLSDSMPRKLIRIAPDHYVSIREHVNRVIARWPDAGITAYRSLFEQRMRESLGDPAASGSVDERVGLLARYFCTATAGRLAHSIAQMALERGDLALAEDVYRRVLDDHPDRALYRQQYEDMLSMLAVMGDPNSVRHQAPDAERTVRWMGQDRPLGAVFGEITASFSSLATRRSPLEWPLFGGRGQRDRLSSTDVDELGLLWRFEVHRRVEPATEGDMPGPTARDRSRQLSVQPVVSGGLVFVQFFREIVALHRNTGAVAWRFRGDDVVTTSLGYADERPPGWDSVTVHDGRVYASLPGDTVPYYSYESARSPSELVCLDATTGGVIWRLDQESIEEEFAEVSFDSSPIVRHGHLFILGRRRRSFGFEDCYLYRFDADSGALAWRLHLGSASTGTFGSRGPTSGIAAMHGDTVYVGTNLGTVAAVDAYTGSVRWLRLYERRSADGEGHSRSGREVKPWRFNPVIYSNGRVITLPLDTSMILVLDAAEGALIQSIPVRNVANIQTLFGVRGDVLCGAGDEVACYDMSERALIWSAPLGDASRTFGRGAWVGDRLLVPSRKRLYSFDVADGSGSDAPWDAPAEGGNLLALPDQILVAGIGSVDVYVRKSDIFDALRRRMAASPTDPLPALELAELALGSGEFSEALAVLDQAVQRASAQAASVSDAALRRLFDAVLAFVRRLSEESVLEEDVLDQLFGYATRFAPTPAEHLQYRLEFAREFEQLEQPKRAVGLYQQVLRDRSLRDLEMHPEAAESETAGAFAQRRVEELIREHGRSVYTQFEREAQKWLETAIARRDVGLVQRLVDAFPNSRSAAPALVTHGKLLAALGRPEEAARRFATAYHRYPRQVDRPEILRRIADSYEAAGMVEHAYRWLTKAAREHPTARMEHKGRAVTFLEYRRRVDHARRRVEPSRPKIELPLLQPFTLKLTEPATLLAPRFAEEPICDWSRCFVASSAGITAIDPHGGAPLWSQPAAVQGTPELLVATSTTAVLATRHEIIGLDAATGARRWTYREPGPPDDVMADWEEDGRLRAHAVHGDRLVSVREGGRMTCLSVETGRLIWSQTHRPIATGGLTFSEPWVIYHVVQDGRIVLCLVDATTGAWVDAIITSHKGAVEKLFVTLDRQLVLVTSSSISSYDPDTGKSRWQVAAGGRVRQASLRLEVDALYFSDDGLRLRKISLEDGRSVWASEPLVPRGADELAVFVEGGSVIIGSTSSVSAVDAVTGLTLWRGTTPERPRLVSRLPTQAYVVTLDLPRDGGEGTAYFYDHRNASGLIPLNGGALPLGNLKDVRTVLALDGALVVQAGDAILGWTHR